MKAFKQICLMSIMLTGGGSVFGMSYMNYLKPALCGGLVGSALALCTRYGNIKEQIAGANARNDRLIKYYEKHFACIDTDSCVETPMISGLWRPAKSQYYRVNEYELIHGGNKLENFFSIKLTLEGMQNILPWVKDKSETSELYRIICSWGLGTENSVKNCLLASIQEAQEGCQLQQQNEKAWLSPKVWPNFNTLCALWKYGAPVAVCGFTVGTVCGAALKYALAK
jgi:hypothetical protein